MLGRLVASTILALALAQGAAFAQGQSSQPGTPGSTHAGQSAQNLPQEIQQKLKSQGFSDVKVVPGSFIVSAKDKQGDPVTMILGPHSMTVFTMSTSGNASTTGAGGNNHNSSGSMSPSTKH